MSDRFIESRSGAAAPKVQTVRQSGKTASVITGYAAVFNSPTVIGGLFREQIAPGTFTEAVRLDDVRALYNHLPQYVLGRTGSGSARIFEDSYGLRYEIHVNPDDAIAVSIAATIQRGDVTGSSFSFWLPDADSEEWTQPDRRGLPLRTITRARLFDVGPVTFPAYDAATAGARHHDAGMQRLADCQHALARAKARR